MFNALQRGATSSAALISLVALFIVFLMSRWDGKRQSAETEATFLALHDPLTGLPNRRQFNTTFREWLDEARSRDGRLAVLCVDVDRFKDVNDEYGHVVGDQLLIHVSETLKYAAGDNGFVARLSGDEFAVLLRYVSGDSEAKVMCDTMFDALREPMVVDNDRVSVSLSVGIGIYPRDGADVDELMINADLALYRAKESGRGRYCVFKQDLKEDLRMRRRLQNDLRFALANDDLQMHFQPQVDTATGDMTGFEALVRWNHPILGMIPPQRLHSDRRAIGSNWGAWQVDVECIVQDRCALA